MIARAGHEARVESRVMLVTVATVATVISVLTSVQSVLVLGVFSATLSGADPLPARELAVRVAINLGATSLAIGAVALAHPERRGGWGRAASIVGISLVCALARASAQAAAGVYSAASGPGRVALVTEIATTGLLLALAITAGLVHVSIWRRAREADRVRLAAQARAASLLRDLQQEELRVRYEVAQTIHGSVQTAFVVLESQVRHIGERSAEPARSSLAEVAGHLSTLREGELRRLSARLYPVDLDRGLSPAIGALLARVPSHVTVSDETHDTLAHTAIDESTRLLIVRIVEEGIANALRHGRARRIAVRADLRADRIVVEVESDGESPRPGLRLSGIARLHRRAELLSGSVRLEPAPDGGAILRAELALGGRVVAE